MNPYQKKGFQQYKRHLNQLTTKLAKQEPARIHHELNKLVRMRIPAAEKQMVAGTLYKKLSPQKRKMLVSHFGQTSPATQAAVTQAATQAAVTQAAATQAAATQAAATQAAPQTAPQTAATTQAAPQTAATQAAPQTAAGLVTTGDYNTAAGAIQGAEVALQQAAQALAAQQGISGFGRRRRRW